MIAPVKGRVEVLHWHGEPERICYNCQHYKRSETKRGVGECHNGISGALETSDKKTCRRGFYPACDRWPIEKLYHG